MRLKKTALALACVSLVGVAACGGGDDDSSGGPGDLEGSDEAGAAGGEIIEAKAPAPEVEGATEGGTATVIADVAPTTLDPTRAYYTDSTAILSSLVTRSLTQYRYNPDTKQMELVPDLATDTGTPNEDFTEWTWTLRDGLKYEDGSEVKAEDVAYAIMRSFAIEELPDGPTYNTQFFLDGDKYQGPFKDGTDYKGVVVDGNKITIKMAKPFGDMPYYASFPQFTAIPESADKNPDEYGNHPLSTGPYKFEDYKQGQYLKLSKNENWDPATDNTRHQFVDDWDFQWGQDQAAMDQTMLDDQGTAQTTFSYTNVAPAVYQQAKDSGRLAEGTSPCTYMWYIDMTKIKDLKIRQALSWAFPYDGFWKADGKVPGVTMREATSLLPPGTAGRKEFESPEGQDGYTTDPEKAKALLKEAGAEGYEIKFPYERDDKQKVAGMEVIKQSLEESGFKVTPIASTTDAIRDVLSDYDNGANVQYQGWCSDWPSGSSWFPAQWDGRLVGLEGRPNVANFDVPEMDKLQDKILKMGPEEAAPEWGNFDEKMMTEYQPAIPIGYSGVAVLRGSKIGGMAIDNVRGNPYFSNIYVKQ
ncbi:ABC transporter substrate-binding protein [Solicola gregarius]|uniref:ABC transporter substrate-binding protein n=1 Tax=Solicola gregarius TaxID=2908642 RepID=A0AA46YLF2_9ACTN|nr:ABC transporter substrate-binding protein [Solicola gregarius]UYM04813.1 ABC transporter substrate-binding protein [Solicola gregarius]